MMNHDRGSNANMIEILKISHTNIAKLRELLIYNRNELVDKNQNIQKIVELVSEEARELVKGLTESEARVVCKSLELCEYRKDQVLFQQGDEANGYYYILDGAVSIHKLANAQAVILDHYIDEEETTADGSDRSRFGPEVAVLQRGMGFGDLGFTPGSTNKKAQAPRRAATVVSLGNDPSTGLKTDKAVLLFLPLPVYMQFLYKLHVHKQELRAKMQFLQRLSLFELWPTTQLEKLAGALRHQGVVPAGRCLVKVGTRVKYIYFIISGEVKVSMPRDAAQEEIEPPPGVGRRAGAGGGLLGGGPGRPNGGGGGGGGGGRRQRRPLARGGEDHTGRLSRAVDVAVLGHGEMYGVCEMMRGRTQSYRNAICLTPVDAWVAEVHHVSEIVHSHQALREVFERIAANRAKWEGLALQYAVKFPNFRVPLRGKMNKLSSYSTRAPVLTRREERHIAHLGNRCNKLLHGARTVAKYAVEFGKRAHHAEARLALKVARAEAERAAKLARELGKVGQLQLIAEFQEGLLAQFAAAAEAERKAAAARRPGGGLADRRRRPADPRVVATLRWIEQQRDGIAEDQAIESPVKTAGGEGFPALPGTNIVRPEMIERAGKSAHKKKKAANRVITARKTAEVIGEQEGGPQGGPWGRGQQPPPQSQKVLGPHPPGSGKPNHKGGGRRHSFVPQANDSHNEANKDSNVLTSRSVPVSPGRSRQSSKNSFALDLTDADRQRIASSSTGRGDRAHSAIIPRRGRMDSAGGREEEDATIIRPSTEGGALLPTPPEEVSRARGRYRRRPGSFHLHEGGGGSTSDGSAGGSEKQKQSDNTSSMPQALAASGQAGTAPLPGVLRLTSRNNFRLSSSFDDQRGGGGGGGTGDGPALPMAIWEGLEEEGSPRPEEGEEEGAGRGEGEGGWASPPGASGRSAAREQFLLRRGVCLRPVVRFGAHLARNDTAARALTASRRALWLAATAAAPPAPAGPAAGPEEDSAQKGTGAGKEGMGAAAFFSPVRAGRSGGPAEADKKEEEEEEGSPRRRRRPKGKGGEGQQQWDPMMGAYVRPGAWLRAAAKRGRADDILGLFQAM